MTQPRRDDHHLLSRYRHDQEHARILTTITLEEQRPIAEAKHYADPADARLLRGIPALTPGGIGSHIQGTRPDALPFLTPSERRA